MPEYQYLVAATEGITCHVVGGALRDVALGLAPRDLDVVVDHGGKEVSEHLAKSLPARIVNLGREQFAAFRIVGEKRHIDIWDRQGVDLESDLGRRDFTLHSFALEIRTGQIADPFHGIPDLIARRLIATSPSSFSADPLRSLRLCRFLAQIGDSRSDSDTVESARAAVGSLTSVAKERVRAELELLLRLPNARAGIETMISLAILPWLLAPDPTPTPAGYDPAPVAHLLERLDLAEEVGRCLSAPVDHYLVRLALLYSCWPDAKRGQVGERLANNHRPAVITKDTARDLEAISNLPALPVDLAGQRWFLFKAGRLWSTTVCIQAALSGPTLFYESGRARVAEISELAELLGDEVFAPRFLISGTDLQQQLGLDPGSRLGNILETVQRRQIEGILSTRTEALDLARKILNGGH